LPKVHGDAGKAKMLAREIINDSTRKFNDNRRKHDPNLPLLPIPFDKFGNLHPSYKKAHYSDRFQKHPKSDGTLYSEPGKGAHRVHPLEREIMTTDPLTGEKVLATKTLSNKDNSDLGEMIEASQFHPFHEFKQGMHNRGLSAELSKLDHALKGGVINPEVQLIDKTGQGRGLRRYGSVEDPSDRTFGNHISSGNKQHTEFGGDPFHVMRAVLALAPHYFDKGRMQSTASMKRADSLRRGVLQNVAHLIPDRFINELAATPVGEMLAAEGTGQSHLSRRDSRAARSSGSGVNNRTEQVLSLLGIPTRRTLETSFGNSPEGRAMKDSFDINAYNMSVDMSGGNFHSAKPLARAAYASLLLARRGDSMRHNLKTELQSYFPNYSPIHPDEVKDIQVTDDMGPKFRGPPASTPDKSPVDTPAPVGISPGVPVGARGRVAVLPPQDTSTFPRQEKPSVFQPRPR